MCMPATCSRCGKTTWQGCGQHVDEVMSEVPADQQCTCPREPQKSLFSRLTGR